MTVSHKMARRYEDHLATLFGGRRTVGSGNQFYDQMDGRQDRLVRDPAFAWDAKATLGQSIGVSRAMWDKAATQAAHEEPMLALGFFDHPSRLHLDLDLVVIRTDTLHHLLIRLARSEAPGYRAYQPLPGRGSG